MMSENDLVSIIIVSWNSKKLLSRCIQSILNLYEQKSIEIIIIDNASIDSTTEYLTYSQKKLPIPIKIIFNTINVGFARAVNSGLKKSNGKYILFLNPDTELTTGCVENLVDIFNKFKDAGIVGGKHIDRNNTIQHSVRSFPHLSSQIGILLKLHHIFPNLIFFKKYFLYDFDYNNIQKVNQVAGSFLMIKKDLLKKINMWDENFFLWFEDVDLCKRINDLGYKIYYTPYARVLHVGGTSFKKLIPYKRQKIFNKSMIYYFKKHHNIYSYILIRLFCYPSLLLAYLYTNLKVDIKNDVRH